MITKKYVNISIYKRNKEHIISNQQKGVNYLFSNNKVKSCFGVAFLVVAFLPNGLFVPCSFIGCWLLGLNKIDIYNYKEKGLRKLKGWYYLK